MALPPRPIVVLTREPEDNAPLKSRLEARGLQVVEIPCSATRLLNPGKIPEGMDAFVFTSKRGVNGFFRLEGAMEALRAVPKPLICSVGKATAGLLGRMGIKADAVADPPNGQVLAGMITERLKPGSRLLMIRGNLRASEIDDMLAGAGFKLIPFTVYENVEPDIQAMEPFPVSSVLVAAPSAGRRLLSANPWMRNAPFVAIGGTTASAMRALGIARVFSAGADQEAWAVEIEKLHCEALDNMKEKE
jgi:uroporphyrinogen-III synthase